MTRRKVAILALAMVTGGAIGQALAPQAHADEASFINNIGNAGLPAGPTALAVGHQVCYDMAVNGPAGLDHEAHLAYNAGLSSDDFATVVVEAVYELCPSNLPALHVWENTV